MSTNSFVSTKNVVSMVSCRENFPDNNLIFNRRQYFNIFGSKYAVSLANGNHFRNVWLQMIEMDYCERWTDYCL